jgi:hypothetical protein
MSPVVLCGLLFSVMTSQAATSMLAMFVTRQRWLSSVSLDDKALAPQADARIA